MCYDELREATVDMCGEIASDTKVRLKLDNNRTSLYSNTKKKGKIGWQCMWNALM